MTEWTRPVLVRALGGRVERHAWQVHRAALHQLSGAALRTLFDRLPGLHLAVPADRIPFKPGDTIQGMLELPVAW
ncbi:hypothetical protein [Streptomyces sp. NPDC058045]|uniref:hypothetical protein n=1 Tax=Streptomyces sp. NPDC058045 TaxID=3346311 RepID=UPI0036E1F722